MIGANFSAYGSTNGMTQTEITLDTKLSKVSLPIVGGYDAAVAAGAFAPETVAPVIGDVPDITVDTAAASTVVTYPLPTATDNEDPSPDVRLHAGLRQHVPRRPDARHLHGHRRQRQRRDEDVHRHRPRPAERRRHRAGDAVADARRARVVRRVHAGRRRRPYTASTTANVISTAGDAALTVTDPSTTHTGHLVNGAFALPQPLQGLGTVKTYTAPVSNDLVTVQFRQPVSSTDALRTGVYAKTLTFTLSTTNP